jgi:hypothetical protein
LGGQIGVASVVYFLLNTAIVGGINSIETGKNFGSVIWNWWRWCAPYYGAGAIVALFIELSNASLGWGFALLLTPVLFLEHLYFKIAANAETARSLFRRVVGPLPARRSTSGR